MAKYNFYFSITDNFLNDPTLALMLDEDDKLGYVAYFIFNFLILQTANTKGRLIAPYVEPELTLEIADLPYLVNRRLDFITITKATDLLIKYGFLLLEPDTKTLKINNFTRFIPASSYAKRKAVYRTKKKQPDWGDLS